MGLFSFLERQAGDAKFSKNLIDQYHSGLNSEKYGRDLTNAGLSGLDDLDARYNNELANGALPDYMARAFDVQRGALTDDAQRSRRAWADDILQTSRRSGGAISPNAALDFQLEHDAKTDESLFTARNALNAEEANMRMTNTNNLLDRIFAIRDRKLGVGQDEEARGVQRALNALQLRYQRNAKIADTIVSSTSRINTGGGGFT